MVRVRRFGRCVRTTTIGSVRLGLVARLRLPESRAFGTLPNTSESTGQEGGQTTFTRFVHRSPRIPGLAGSRRAPQTQRASFQRQPQGLCREMLETGRVRPFAWHGGDGPPPARESRQPECAAVRASDRRPKKENWSARRITIPKGSTAWTPAASVPGLCMPCPFGPARSTDDFLPSNRPIPDATRFVAMPHEL